MNEFKEIFDNIYEHILKAREEARKQLIEANTIIIDKYVARSNNLFFQENNVIRECPPMIFGMKVYYGNNLPNNANFIITQTPKNKMEQINKLEKYLGIDLITLFKALEDGIYTIRSKGKKRYPFLTYNNAVGYILDFEFEQEAQYILSDYGETWALTKEELEGDE